MADESIIREAEFFVKSVLGGDSSGHDWWHIERVRKLAIRIAQEENANIFICELAALLHDIADGKLNESESVGMNRVLTWLDDHGVLEDDKKSVLDIIQNMSFKGGLNHDKVLSLEGQIVQDADRLDAIGAIGVARTMAYAGSRGNLIHVPGTGIRSEMTLEEYRNQESTAIAHFYEKLLLLKDLMNTATAKQLAEKRHAFMEEFLKEFYAEWDGIF
ncbi:HD domain-containing protein [Streptococcus thoraltensis]|uniref:HD domain-containing protein n=1 Tax=Streptococcus thoraltensis TaxID=55085 RepID=UPI000362BAC3|nr:HD domain-containing protein [Streptococcus thoraltensis]MDY4762117.1 HD domain-containing protein [Streptococcus thoraltensis]